MKKFLLLLVGGMLLTGVASANSILVACNGTQNASNGSWTINSFQLVCPQLTLPAGDGIYDVEIFAQDSFNQGFPTNSGNQVTFTFVNIIPALGFAGNTYQDIMNGTPGSSYTANGDFFQFGNTLSGTGWLGGGTVNVAMVSAAQTGGATTSGSNDSVNFYVQFDYGTIPEPVTMVLVGGGLLGLGFVAKRRKKA